MREYDMNTKSLKINALVGVLVLASSSAMAADISLNGFASFYGGRAVYQNKLKGGIKTSYLADPLNATSNGFLNEQARYGDDLTFRPDTSYSLQFNANLGTGLKAVAQVMGQGSNDFETEIEWAYLTYELTDNLTIQAGRQRTPLFFYSDFVDVGYAYHWIRPPAEVYGISLHTYEGASLTYTSSLGSLNTQARIYGGSGTSERSSVGDFNADSVYGVSYLARNEWIQIRLSALKGDFYNVGTTTDKDNPVDTLFGSASLHLSLGNFFLISEATMGKVKDDYLDLFQGLSQTDGNRTFMVSGGYEIGDFTPHITFARSSVSYTGDVAAVLEGLDEVVETTTVGMRWDFHPSAAFKVEYSYSADESDKGWIDLVGRTNDVDVVAFGFDVIF